MWICGWCHFKKKVENNKIVDDFFIIRPHGITFSRFIGAEGNEEIIKN